MDLARELWPSLWRGGLAVAAVSGAVLALVATSLAGLDDLVRDQYQVQQTAVARHARDRLVHAIDGVVAALEAVREGGAAALAEPRHAPLASLLGAVYAVGNAGPGETLFGSRRLARPVDQPAGATWLLVHERTPGGPGLLTVGVPSGEGWIVAEVSLARLGAVSVGDVERYMSGYPWVVDATDATRLARRQVRRLLVLGLLLAAVVGAVGPVALAVSVRQRQRERAAVYRSIASLVRAMEARDPYTRGHSENVAYYVARLAEQMGHAPSLVARVYQGGLLHDLGKIGVPDAILNKPGRLEGDELRLIQAHPCVGHEILAEIDALGDVVPIVRHHHERMDGGGYPDRLHGDAIPLEARIVAVADVLDALTTDRPYRSGMSLPAALDLMRTMRGAHLDAEVVDGLLGCIDDIWDPRRVSIPSASPQHPPAAGGAWSP